jgi:hypothetical protein
MGGDDCLKMNYAQMKSTEIKMLLKLVKAGEDRPLTVADLALLVRIRFALHEYEAQVGQQHLQAGASAVAG